MAFSNTRKKLLTLEKLLKDAVEEHKECTPANAPVVASMLKAKLGRIEAAMAILEQQASTAEEFKFIEDHMEELLIFTESVEDRVITLQMSTPKKDNNKLNESMSGLTLNTKLPTLELGVFDGNRLKFANFWSSFLRRIDDKDIPAGDKFEYLKQSLTPEVGLCISGLLINDVNYERAKDTLVKRYGDPSQQIDAHRTAIMMLPTCKNTTTDLSKTYFQIEEHLNNLQILGEETKLEEFFPLVKSKFPVEICVHIEESVKDDEKYTLSLFRAKLSRIINIREKNERVTFQDKPKESTSRSEIIPSWRKEEKGGSPYRGKYPNSPRTFSQVMTTGVMSPERKPQTPCIYCQGKHWNDDCDAYTTVEDRRRKLYGRCFVCLSLRHMSNDCPVEKPCFHCGQIKRHHRSLCPEYVRKLASLVNTIATESSEAEKPDEEAPTVVAVVNSNRDTYLPSALAVVCTEEAQLLSVKVLLDSASQSTFVSESLAKRLKLKILGYIRMDLSCFGAKVPVTTVCPTSEIMVRIDGGLLRVGVIIVPFIASQTATGWYFSEIDRARRLYPNLTINQPPKSGPFDILLGVDYYFRIVGGRNIPLGNGMYLVETRLGFLLVGKKKLEVNGGMCLLSQVRIEPDQSCVCWPSSVDVSRFWDLEILGLYSGLDDDQSEAVENFNKSIELRNGRYFVSWPWKFRPPPLPDNFGLAYGRLCSVVKQLKLKNEMQEYNQIFVEQESTGIIERVEGRCGGIEHYVPHLAVRRGDHKTTKLRVVFDASSKAKKVYKSLNDCLLKGRSLLEDLLMILFRFRLYPIVLLADIEKAFLQLGLKEEEDKNAVRFLWLKDPSKDCKYDNLQIFRFSRVAFGVVSSPFLLNAVIRHHIGKYLADFPVISKFLTQSIYVDNVVLSCPTEEIAKEIYTEAKKLFSVAAMNLREWITNSENVRNIVSEVDRSECECVENVLGVKWDVSADVICLKPPECVVANSASKRTVLKFIAGVFDPFGFLAPTLLLGKLLLKELWVKKYEWDTELSESEFNEWRHISNLILNGISKVRPSRCINFQDCKNIEIHGFVDASLQSYHANVYVRLVRECGKVEIFLLLSKNRVTPVKDNSVKLTIPRLELLALCIGCKCIESVRKLFESNVNAFIWSDSQCALKWIKTGKVLPIFEENRVKVIRSIPNLSCRFIPGEINPVDCATRKIENNSYLDGKSWWHGPEFLSKNKECWPTWDTKFEDLPEEKLEYPIVVAKVATEPVALNPPYDINLNSFTDLDELFQETWWKSGKDGMLDREEMLNVWIKFVQSVCFQNELADERVMSKSKLKLFQENGIIKCETRLSNSTLSDGATHPILLPRKNRLTDLIIKNVHEASKHVGAPHTLSLVNQRFYVPRGLSQVNKVLAACPECIRMKCGPYKLPEMPPLPVERVTRSVPFVHVGLDGLGPVLVTRNREVMKVWVLLITCLATRAIHLVVMDGLSAQNFMYALREFIGLRTCPETILCDNATAFHSVASVSKNLWWSILEDEAVQNYPYSAHIQIKWRFIPASSPFAGGVYERLVALFKHCYTRTIFDLTLTYAQFRVFTCEVQGILNSRPICPLDREGEYLTPNHFLNIPLISQGPLFNRKTLAVCGEKSEEVLYLWKKGVKLLDRFWKIWHKRYLIFLTNRRSWRVKQNRIVSKIIPKLGERVLIGDSRPRPNWQVGKIILLEGSRDGEVRTVVVETAGGMKLRRSIGMLYPFESSCSELEQYSLERSAVREEEGNGGESDSAESEMEVTVREVEEEGDAERTIRADPDSVELPPAAKILKRRGGVEVESLERSGSGSLAPGARSVANAREEGREGVEDYNDISIC